MKSSGVREENAGTEIPSRSVVSCSPPMNSLTATPRPSRSPSWASGLPPPVEKRTRASTGSPLRNGARHNAVPSGVAVKVPFAQAPLTWTARPSCSPKVEWIASIACWASVSVAAIGRPYELQLRLVQLAQLAAQLADLVAQARGVLEAQVVGRRQHLLLELDDRLLELR